jgi:fimbrial chaperone protein
MLATKSIAQRLLLALMLAGGASAGAVTIAPVIVELSPVRKVVSVTVTNPGDSVLNFQAEVLAWRQVDGKDTLEATKDVLVVPPVAAIAAGASQIFRVTSRLPPSNREQAYRIILEDVSAEIAGPANSAIVNIRVRHSLPVFVAATGTPAVALQVTQCAAAAGKGCVRIVNEGGRYVMAKSMRVEGGDWSKDIALNMRVLVGGYYDWQFDLPARVAATLNVKAETSAGSFSGTLSNLSR